MTAVVPGSMALGEARVRVVHGATPGVQFTDRSRGFWSRRRASPRLCLGISNPNYREFGEGRWCVSTNSAVSGGTPTAKLRLNTQKVMQEDCAVFRTGEMLDQGHKRIHEVTTRHGRRPRHDRSLIWNSDLIETLGLDNLIAQAVATWINQELHREPRRTCARRLS